MQGNVSSELTRLIRFSLIGKLGRTTTHLARIGGTLTKFERLDDRVRLAQVAVNGSNLKIWVINLGVLGHSTICSIPDVEAVMRRGFRLNE
jgi:hypothetical protein